MNAGSGAVDRGVIGSGGTNQPESALGSAPPEKAPSTAVSLAAPNHSSPVGGGSPILIDHKDGNLVPTLKIGSTVFHDQSVITSVEFNRRLAVHIRRVVFGPIAGCSLINFCMVASPTFISPGSDEGVVGRRGRSGAISQTGEDGGAIVGIQPKFKVGVTSGGEVGGSEINRTRSYSGDPSLKSGGGAGGVEYGTIIYHRQ